jgi:hypothetical protein
VLGTGVETPHAFPLGSDLTATVNDHKSPKLRAPWPLAIATYLGVFALAGIAELAGTHIHGTTNDSFFVVCGTIAPLFGLALFVDIALVMRPVVKKQGLTDTNRATLQLLVRVNSGMLIISEAAALYAVGTEAASPFLVGCCVLPWLVQIYFLAQTAYDRAGASQLEAD